MEYIIIILSILTPLCTIAAFLLARSEAIKKRGQNDGELLNEIKTTRRMVEDIKASYEKLNTKIDLIVERVARVEESNKQAHKRLDGFENRSRPKNREEGL